MLFLETVSLGYIEKLLLCGHRGACLPMEERRKHNFCEVISKHFKFQIHVAAVEVNIFLLLFSNTVVSQVPGSLNLIVFLIMHLFTEKIAIILTMVCPLTENQFLCFYKTLR